MLLSDADAAIEILACVTVISPKLTCTGARTLSWRGDQGQSGRRGPQPGCRLRTQTRSCKHKNVVSITCVIADQGVVDIQQGSVVGADVERVSGRLGRRGRDEACTKLASFAYACYKKDKELKTCNLPVRATRRTRRTDLQLVSACMLWCVLQCGVCVVNKSGGTIRYDCMVSLFASGLSYCLGPPGYLNRSVLTSNRLCNNRDSAWRSTSRLTACCAAVSLAATRVC